MTTRRDFLRTAGMGAGLTAIAGVSALNAACNPMYDKAGVALVGLGNYATGQLGPALKETSLCRLAGVVTGDPEKGQKWSEEYGFDASHIYSYETFDQIAEDDSIDLIYVVLPNAMHAEYVIRAAQAGKHVMTEKPMAVSVEECDRMIKACNETGVTLSVGYRCHFEPHNQEMMKVAAEQRLGALKLIDTGFGFRAMGYDNWRFHHDLAGGGALMDVGIYCIQAACYLTKELPINVSAQEVKTYPDRFVDVDETILFQLEFPSGIICNGSTSYAINTHHLDVYCEQGSFGLSPAFGYDGLQGYIGQEKLELGQIREQALHMDHVIRCIRGEEELKTPGEMGRRDMKIIEAIYEAVSSSRTVELTW